jgi:hypothetical protein
MCGFSALRRLKLASAAQTQGVLAANKRSISSSVLRVSQRWDEGKIRAPLVALGVKGPDDGDADHVGDTKEVVCLLPNVLKADGEEERLGD